MSEVWSIDAIWDRQRRQNFREKVHTRTLLIEQVFWLWNTCWEPPALQEEHTHTGNENNSKKTENGSTLPTFHLYSLPRPSQHQRHYWKQNSPLRKNSHTKLQIQANVAENKFKTFIFLNSLLEPFSYFHSVLAVRKWLLHRVDDRVHRQPEEIQNREGKDRWYIQIYKTDGIMWWNPLKAHSCQNSW
jgi:hypothetical protein